VDPGLNPFKFAPDTDYGPGPRDANRSPALRATNGSGPDLPEAGWGPPRVSPLTSNVFRILAGARCVPQDDSSRVAALLRRLVGSRLITHSVLGPYRPTWRGTRAVEVRKEIDHLDSPGGTGNRVSSRPSPIAPLF
jgi:hypothetical protein